MVGTFYWEDVDFSYSWWRGEILQGTAEKPLSFDTETELIRPVRPPKPEETLADVPTDPTHVPRPALAMAFDGNRLVLIHPTQLAAFVLAHRSKHWVGHNLQFDWWVTARYCGRATQEVLWQLGDHNRLHDTQLMDMLLQLGTGKYRHGANYRGTVEERRLYPTNLGVLSDELGCGELDKTDPYRLRFGEMLGKSPTEMQAHAEAAGFFSYALKDVIATWRVYQKQRDLGLAVMRRAGWSPDKAQKKYEIRPDAVEKFGVLSETLQTKASIVLAELSRTPLRINQEKRAEAERSARARYAASLNKLLAVEPGLIKVYKIKRKRGTVKVTKKSLLPQFDQKRLVAVLEAEAARLNCLPLKSDGKLKGTSTSAKAWKKFADRSEFIAAWVELEKEAKLLEFLTAIDAPYVYSNYSILMMNGRTSAGAHRRKGETLVPSVNVQQMPREDPKHPERSVRSLFEPPVGFKWFSCDYGYVELRTLAAVCRARYGWSKLGDAVVEHTTKGGVDPHQRTAAMIAGLTVEDFLACDKNQQKSLRQSAKAVNFGYPGGLGVAKFVEYAQTTYGVEFTKLGAKNAKKKWLALYPELKLYLGDHTHEAMEWQTGKKVPQLEWFERKRLSDFVRADDKERAEWSDEETERWWDWLERLAYLTGDEKVIADVDRRKVTGRVRQLLTYRACTFTGRVRANVTYTDGANTPFSGLAADGAKLAMWNLMRRGTKLLSFVHDALDVAIDPRAAKNQCATVEKIMIESMQEVIGQGIPVAVDGALADCWAKA